MPVISATTELMMHELRYSPAPKIPAARWEASARGSIKPYWTWKRLGVLVRSLSEGRILTPGDWQALHREIPSLSYSKKVWLYWQLKQYYPAGGMKDLFHGWRPAAPPVELSSWME